jgi:hypothetical protein
MGGVAAAYAEVVVLARVPGFIVNESPFHHFALCSNTLSFNSFKPLIRVITAASHDSLERVPRMNGVDINTTTPSGSTALMGVAWREGGRYSFSYAAAGGGSLQRRQPHLAKNDNMCR